MADRAIIYPRLLKKRGNNRQEMLTAQTGYADGANSFPAFSFVVYASSLIGAVATAGVSCCGYVLDADKASTAVNPPTQFFGDKHWPINPRGCQFLVNISNNANAVGQANSAPQLSAVSIGTSYGLTRPTSGTYSGYQFLNTQDTSTTLFTIVDIPASVDGVDNSSTVYNGLVLVELIESKIQVV